jgi:hypothetical protein
MRQTPLAYPSDAPKHIHDEQRAYIAYLFRVLPPLRAAHPPCLAHKPSA